MSRFFAALVAVHLSVLVHAQRIRSPPAPSFAASSPLTGKPAAGVKVTLAGEGSRVQCHDATRKARTSSRRVPFGRYA